MKCKRFCSSIKVTVKGPYVMLSNVSSGQYWLHFVFVPSIKLVSITIYWTLSCHINHQKSSMVLGRGPS